MFFRLILLALPLLRTLAVPTPHDSHDHLHNVRKALPTTWYQPRDHPVHDLFKRAPGDGTDYAAVGTPDWSAGFPTGTPNPNALPAAWVAALNAAVAAGKIPNIPPTTNTPGTNPVYAAGFNPNGPAVCSATYKCRIPGDIWDSPDGVFASSFDDGPTPSTPSLVQFLETNNETTTHFMIGINILYYPSQFLLAFNGGHDIAVHTWTHPYMTTLSNLDVLGQLGYTMQLIHNSTGGRVPRYWRPPYGDSDMRVRSIALEVFGLETVVWNQDTSDWNGTPPSIEAAMTQFLTGPKSPGVIILEHELTDITVNGFMTAYPMIKSNGWQFVSLAKAIGDGHTYQNAEDSSSNDVVPAGILVAASSSSTSAAPSTSAASSGSTSATPSIASASGQNLSPSPTPSKSSAVPLRSTLPNCFALSSLLLSALTSVIVLLS
ncbi:hypothetical protein BDZ97DRAFT_1900211 [Flammula alnicola]|nr:hypothetical protein BDZ97DRAFT_1900211 [Flammula alnicola]